jgi:hypothetical protein
MESGNSPTRGPASNLVDYFSVTPHPILTAGLVNTMTPDETFNLEPELAGLESHIRRILQDKTSEVTSHERVALQVLHLEVHVRMVELFATTGRTIAGNNPLRPN